MNIYISQILRFLEYFYILCFDVVLTWFLIIWAREVEEEAVIEVPCVTNDIDMKIQMVDLRLLWLLVLIWDYYD